MLEQLAHFITSFISNTGYIGIGVLMTLESANIPIPSEVVMPFSGYLAAKGVLNFWLVVVMGALGCTIGSIISYYLGRISDRTWVHSFVEGWGRIIITRSEHDMASRWLRKYGDWVVFFSRLLPVVRTFISFPAGIAGVHFGKFVVLSFLGSLIWSYFLTEVGFKLEQHWDSLSVYFRQFDYLVLAGIIILLGWLIYHRGRNFVRTK